MSAISVQTPFPIFNDIDGQPLEAGYVFVGVANLDPQVNPVAVFFDEALTQPAGQPIRTMGGYAVNSGTPTNLYSGSDYSIRVTNKNGSVIYSAPVAQSYLALPADLAGTGPGKGADLVGFIQADTGAVARTVQAKLIENVSVKDFGAVGDGVTDDTVALQSALDSNRIVSLPPGKYRITSSLLVDPVKNRNCGLVGLVPASRYPAVTQPDGISWDGTKESVIFYDGPASLTTAVIAASAEVIGVEPPALFKDTIWTLFLSEITLDANSKAGYGLYCARVQDLQLSHIRARGATIAGVSINGTYSGSARGVRCYLNPGRGFELGAADSRYGWTLQDKINAFYIYDLHCDANGSDSTFRQASPTLQLNNCGVFFGPHRSAHIYGVVSENNFGANIVFAPSGSGNSIQGYYTELGCRFLPSGPGSDAISLGFATTQIGVIFVGADGGGSQNCRLVDGITASDKVILTGVQPTPARKESGFEIYNNSLSNGLISDWSNYRLVNCSLELENITGSPPLGAFTVKGGIQFESGASVLSDYQIGSFTPTVIGSTTPGNQGYSIQVGRFQRIGQVVHVQGSVIVNSTDSAATGLLRIGGLPFPAATIGNYIAAVAIPYYLGLGGSVVITGGSIASGAAFIETHASAPGGVATVNASSITGTTRFRFSASYQIA